MTSVLADFVTTRNRFGRSANIERDHGDSAIDGYIPTGRALDVISRIGAGLTDPAAGRTFSIVGPHGGGKSSLAVFLDSLLAAPNSAEYKAAHRLLASVDRPVDDQLRAGVRQVKAGRTGFIRAFATARIEPVAATIARALYLGANRKFGHGQELVPPAFESPDSPPTSAEIRRCVVKLAEAHPVLLVIDEFGKNLEHFASSDTDGDPFLLQELAELTQGTAAAPLVLITMQHQSFDEYIQDTSTVRRREWAKVQGRFQDIPYLETSTESYRLVAASLEQKAALRKAADRWVAANRAVLEEHGLREVAVHAASAIPLHPMALAVLPELCSRYGQNERTLFSFMTGSEPAALPSFLKRTPWEPNAPLPLAGVDLLYDYFLESWSNTIGVADGVSRWMEIETRIRDTPGLSDEQLRVLKTIGLLNLISSGGKVRASRAVLGLALDEAGPGNSGIDQILSELVDTGLITYRAFSDEYRIWQGSDYNMRRAIDGARRSYAQTPLVDLLKDALTPEPLVAGRHSQRNGILRVFGRQFSDGPEPTPPSVDPSWDGIVYYVTQPNFEYGHAKPLDDGRPAVYVIPHGLDQLRESAIEAAALGSALRSAEAEDADWVARRELVERLSAAQQRLHTLVGATWNQRADWIIAGSGRLLDPRHGLSALLSEVADLAYPDTPHIANEMIARRELTSQGAKARRFLMEALLVHHDSEAFKIDGYGPERAIYEAIFRKTGIHRCDGDGQWALRPPTARSWKPLWSVMNATFGTCQPV